MTHAIDKKNNFQKISKKNLLLVIFIGTTTLSFTLDSVCQVYAKKDKDKGKGGNMVVMMGGGGMGSGAGSYGGGGGGYGGSGGNGGGGYPVPMPVPVPMPMFCGMGYRGGGGGGGGGGYGVGGGGGGHSRKEHVGGSGGGEIKKEKIMLIPIPAQMMSLPIYGGDSNLGDSELASSGGSYGGSFGHTMMKGTPMMIASFPPPNSGTGGNYGAASQDYLIELNPNDETSNMVNGYGEQFADSNIQTTRVVRNSLPISRTEQNQAEYMATQLNLQQLLPLPGEGTRNAATARRRRSIGA